MYLNEIYLIITRNGVFWGKYHHQSQPVWASTSVSLHFPSLRWVLYWFFISITIDPPINCLFVTGIVLNILFFDYVMIYIRDGSFSSNF